jgi:flagellar protein FlaG
MVNAVFTESILLIASLTIAGIFASMVISKSSAVQSLFATQTQVQRDIMLTNIKIVYVNANADNNIVKAYVKNIGINPIVSLDSVDVYFGELNSLSKIPYNTASAPKWIYSDSSNTWNPKQTRELVITLDYNLQANKTYMLKVVLHNGIADEYIFST